MSELGYSLIPLKGLKSLFNGTNVNFLVLRMRTLQNGIEFAFAYFPSSPLVVRDSTLPPVDEWKYLGVTIDSHLSLSFHIRNVCRSAYFHLYHIDKIRRFLDASTAHRLVYAIILSRLDYCNSTFSGQPSALLYRLQMVLNSAARLFLRFRRQKQRQRDASPTIPQLAPY
jgi:hypothetical protein